MGLCVDAKKQPTFGSNARLETNLASQLPNPFANIAFISAANSSSHFSLRQSNGPESSLIFDKSNAGIGVPLKAQMLGKARQC